MVISILWLVLLLRPSAFAEEYRCIDAPEGYSGPNAYAVMVGPISARRKYSKWLYPILALRQALIKSGSKADLLILAAVEGPGGARMTQAEESMLSSQGVRIRYVRAPKGVPGFHMGHYKLWAWQHTEYSKIQLLDADVLPLTNMDRFFTAIDLANTNFLACPGMHSVINAGWFLFRPSCTHFHALTTLLASKFGSGQRRPSAPWDDANGWGAPFPSWRNSGGKLMPPGHDFFDSKGNQGHMYAYFRFFANDLVLIYSDRVEAYTSSQKREHIDLYKAKPDDTTVSVIAKQADKKGTAPTAESALAKAVYDFYPCPFGLGGRRHGLQSAYHHFTGNIKPWTKYDPSNQRFRQWYDVLAEIGIDVHATIFNSSFSSSSLTEKGGILPANGLRNNNLQQKRRALPRKRRRRRR